ncbi:glycoside hydrolase family 108 protein [Salipiger bermudensis]|uniref:glycoside hydrolase family 108 protein n=1 Tax=Salipiger bermudensis TaxID=344736 RepID=UPI001A905D6E|nr:glycoside hydrolase family 108 protein [Salipiger bermudensis]MBN9678837.1 glycoside hydrolase family 108 protein [Salipiger bermudensis]
MAPLISLAISLVPDLAKRLVDNVLPDVEAKITQRMREALGTTDANEAARRASDPEVAGKLRLRLAEIEAEAERREAELQVERMKTQLDTLKAEFEDTKDARNMLADLTEKGSIMAWGPVLVSIVVVVGFFWVLGALITEPETLNGQNSLVFQVINIAVGALTAGFATVISFWLGSSEGSRNKDQVALKSQAIVSDMQRANAQTTKEIVVDQLRQTTALVQNAPRGSSSALVSRSSKDTKSARHFHRCMDVILLHEGGYADNPSDPGGATNFGITHKTLADWRKVAACSADEVKALTVDEAKEIYRAHYWNALNCDQLPKGVDLVTFDMGVNAGVGRSARMLQEVLAVKADGQVGSITVGAASQTDPEFVISRFSDMRLEFYKSLSKWDTFGRGWARRVAETRETALEWAQE